MIVVIDGPAGSGKSSTAKAVAANLQIQFLDSGALYRVATLVYLNSNKELPQFIDMLKESEISFYFKQKTFHSFLNGQDVSDQIRSMEVSENVSEVASNPDVRAFVNGLMHEAVKHDIYIADGRDLGTAVFPDAALKFYMVADLETRAKRRFEEVKASGKKVTLEEVKQNIAARDEKDSNRSSDPLKKADDAILVDTSEMTFEEQVTFISNKIKELINQTK
ncbi:MAG: cytidylate kinase [Balneola sp.]|jgi:cytidylate kinase|nr:cytidylate kinase [Balneola sp.]MBE78843.1 cytidylate kinase [Balneola sp.]HBX66294.1 (d)CMP kinase [Balneolaceae bacterium]|tara:strand:- start:489 stop:1151 length:663 start_codon:yes stop_codon:yes gene_type:complete